MASEPGFTGLSTSPLSADYAQWLAGLKERVRAEQIKAAISANRELILLCWDLGRAILRAQQEQGWGAKVVVRLAVDLRKEFPEMSGFSRANLLFMGAFAEAWPAPSIVLQPVRQLAPQEQSQAVRQCALSPPEPVASLPWGHNLVLLHRLEQGGAV